MQGPEEPPALAPIDRVDRDPLRMFDEGGHEEAEAPKACELPDLGHQLCDGTLGNGGEPGHQATFVPTATILSLLRVIRPREVTDPVWAMAQR